MVKEKLPQQIYNVLEKPYETFYHVVFLEVCKSYGITKNFLLLWEEELATAQYKLIELTIIESVQKLSDLEPNSF